MTCPIEQAGTKHHKEVAGRGVGVHISARLCLPVPGARIRPGHPNTLTTPRGLPTHGRSTVGLGFVAAARGRSPVAGSFARWAGKQQLGLERSRVGRPQFVRRAGFGLRPGKNSTEVGSRVELHPLRLSPEGAKARLPCC